jgi:hypothetical protein
MHSPLTVQERLRSNGPGAKIHGHLKTTTADRTETFSHDGAIEPTMGENGR